MYEKSKQNRKTFLTSQNLSHTQYFLLNSGHSISTALLVHSLPSKPSDIIKWWVFDR